MTDLGVGVFLLAVPIDHHFLVSFHQLGDESEVQQFRCRICGWTGQYISRSSQTRVMLIRCNYGNIIVTVFALFFNYFVKKRADSAERLRIKLVLAQVGFNSRHDYINGRSSVCFRGIHFSVVSSTHSHRS